jgi:putative FmdB family regulatory protein
MPTYAYRCQQCAHEFDAVQKFSDDPIRICPECGGDVRKVFQPVGVVFKGSGWYINDSRGKSSTAVNGANDTAKKAESTTSNGSSSESPSTESKPAAATAETSKPAKAAAD